MNVLADVYQAKSGHVLYPSYSQARRLIYAVFKLSDEPTPKHIYCNL